MTDQKFVKYQKKSALAVREPEREIVDAEIVVAGPPPTLAITTAYKRLLRIVDGASPATAYLMERKQGDSRDTMEKALKKIARMIVGDEADIKTFPWALLDFRHVNWIRSRLNVPEIAHTSANLYLAALRGVLKVCAAMGLMPYENMHRALAAAKIIKGHREPAGRAITDDELGALLGSCDRATAIGARDAVMLSLLYGCGLRRAEVVGLKIESVKTVSSKKGRVTSIVVLGKGGKERTLYLGPLAIEILADWLRHRGADKGPLLRACDTEGLATKRPFTTQGLYSRLMVLVGRSDLEHMSPHDFRKTFITEMFERGKNINTIQKMAGHTSVQTTIGYDRSGEELKIEAMLEHQSGRVFKNATRSDGAKK